MRKILFASTIMVICFFIFLFVGLNKKNNLSENVMDIPKITTEKLPVVVIPDKSVDNQTNVEQKKPLYSSDGTFKSIYESLTRNKSVFEISWAPNNQYVTFAIGNQDWWGYAYIWVVGDHEPIQLNVPEERIGEFIWSPNSQYVLISVGTSPLRVGYLIEAENLTVSEPFSFMMRPAFSPDSTFIALATPSDHNLADVAVSPSQAFELSIYNNETNEKKILIPTDDVHNLYPVKWINNETILYKKVHVSKLEEKELQIKIDLAKINSPPLLLDEAAYSGDEKEIITLINKRVRYIFDKNGTEYQKLFYHTSPLSGDLPNLKIKNVKILDKISIQEQQNVFQAVVRLEEIFYNGKSNNPMYVFIKEKTENSQWKIQDID